jgi:outer membrane lipoprotein-sorting protein
MRILRTLPTTRLLAAIAVVVLLAVAGAAVAGAAKSGGGKPPAEPLAQAIHDALSAPSPSSISGRVDFTNGLFPSGSLIGQNGTPLLNGASGRFWIDQHGGRIELQSQEGGGDVQIVWTRAQATLYDASSQTAYVFDLPAQSGSQKQDKNKPPAVGDISSFLSKLAQHWNVSGAQPSNVAHRPAYMVSVSPSHDGGLLGKAELAWDSVTGVPLKIAIYAQGQSQPTLALTATDISFDSVSDSDVRWTPPAGTKVVDVATSRHDHGGHGGSNSPPVTGLANVQAQAGFPVAAPDSLVGLPRQDVRLVGRADSRAALAVYGQGLGAIVVIERKADTSSSSGSGGMLGSVPTISLDGVSAHELSTPLGTVVTWDRGGVSYVLAGSVPAAAAQAAATALK